MYTFMNKANRIESDLDRVQEQICASNKHHNNIII